MTRPPTRTPGEPAPGDRDFGPLGGLVDDVYFWERNRKRTTEAEADHLLRGAAARHIDRRGRRTRLASALASLGHRLSRGA